MRVHARGRPARVCGVHHEHRLRLVYSTVAEEALEDAGLVDDCAPFPGLMRYCLLVASASVTAAHQLCRRHTKLAINLTGAVTPPVHARVLWRNMTSVACQVVDIMPSGRLPQAFAT